jgi:hypothetical protein
MRFLRRLRVRISGLVCFAVCCAVSASALSETNTVPSAVKAAPSNNDLPAVHSGDSVEIPGTLSSFLRMAGVSQEVPTGDVLPMLARNVDLLGFDGGKPTEYLLLLDRYLHFARELQSLANANGSIRITGCRDAGHLLETLGYGFQQDCGHRNTALRTANAERAFLTIDSGFPLTALEEALVEDRSFSYSFRSTTVPLILPEQDWLSATTWKRKPDTNLLDTLLHDQDLDRLYAALAKCDAETRVALDHSPGLKRLVPYAAVVDLYGSQITIRSGKVMVPGAESGWEDLVGASAHSPGQFVTSLLSKDRGWLAAYFDVLSRLDPTEQAQLTQGTRLKRFYGAYRSTVIRSEASKGVYPSNGELFLLLGSLQWKPDGDLAVPGDLATWDQILREVAKSREMRPWIGPSHEWNTSGRLLETLISASNYQLESGPTQMFLMLHAIDSVRPANRQLSNQTQELVARRFAQFNHWFPIFAEFPALDDAAIARFVDTADRIDNISNPALRANALGAFQAEIGLWQIFARQGQIPTDHLNSSWQQAVEPFLSFTTSVELFDAAWTSLQATVQAAGGNGTFTQDQIIDLLGGPNHDDSDSRRVHHEIANRIRAVLDDQRLVSLDALFGLYDGMAKMAHGALVGTSLLALAENLREFEMPRPIFTGSERSSWAPVVYTSRHAELQVRTDLTRLLKTTASPSQLEAARGQLTPFLRDTLVGLNYAYYEPPGAEVLHNNPIFVRSHDFSFISIEGVRQIWGVPQLVGVGATAGGGAYLLGSLADLPYALAATEADFIVPKKVQALIWREIVPVLLVGATMPRWWNVSKTELHSAALYQQTGEELLKASARNPELRTEVTGILSDRLSAVRLESMERALQDPQNAMSLISQMLPSDIFYLAEEYRKRYPGQSANWGPAGRELEDLCQRYPSDASLERLSADFGAPHPAFNQTNSPSLVHAKAISTIVGTGGMIFAESWESNNLYWARLANEMGYSPVELNLLVPQLTRNMVANIFASNIDDWAALLRAMQETGNEFRQGKIMLQAAVTPSSQ